MRATFCDQLWIRDHATEVLIDTQAANVSTTTEELRCAASEPTLQPIPRAAEPVRLRRLQARQPRARTRGVLTVDVTRIEWIEPRPSARTIADLLGCKLRRLETIGVSSSRFGDRRHDVLDRPGVDS